MHVHVLRTFTRVHLHKGGPPHLHKGGRPHPFVDSFMDGCVGAGEAADAAETHVNVRNTCTCMHTLRATSDPHGHGLAHRAGGHDSFAFL